MARMATEFAVIDAPMARPKIALRCRAVRPSLITFRHNARRGVMRMGPHLVVLALAVAVGGALGWGGLSIDVGFAPRSEQVAQPSVDDVAAGYPAPPAGAPAWLPHNTASPLAEATPAADASTDPQLASLVSATDSEAPSASLEEEQGTEEISEEIHGADELHEIQQPAASVPFAVEPVAPLVEPPALFPSTESAAAELVANSTRSPGVSQDSAAASSPTDDTSTSSGTEASIVTAVGDAIEPQTLPNEAVQAQPLTAADAAPPPISEDTVGAAITTAAVAPADDTTADEVDTSKHNGAAPESQNAPPEQMSAAAHSMAPSSQDLAATAPHEPARFKGLQPGRATTLDAQKVLGKPRQTQAQDGLVESIYPVEPPCSHVVITFERDIAISILVELERAVPAEMLARELTLDPLRAVDVLDEQGRPLGQAFPERGVLFTYSADGKAQQVSRLIIERIDAQPFVLRGETRWRHHLQASLTDAETAITVAPQHASAHALKARVLAEVGKFAEARSAAAQARELEPDNVVFQLLEGRVLERSGDFAGAWELVRDLATADQLPPLLKAQALWQAGNAVALGEQRDYKQALTYHLEAINLAKKLTADETIAVRDAAQELLLEAHLSVANDIAWGGWRSKTTVVPQWLDQAAGIASKYDPQPAHPWWRFRLAQSALATYAGMQGQSTPGDWIAQLEKHSGALLEATTDPLSRQALEWQLGLALYDALQIEHLAGEFAEAQRHGRRALELLEPQLPLREPFAGQSYMLGRLYYRLGALRVAISASHDDAVALFNKAIPLLEEPIPLSGLADSGRQGETFVSMAVSFWEDGKRDEAVRLTKQGATLMERAVREGILDQKSLAIPYQNLASMHHSLGNSQEAKSFAERASRLQTRQ